MMHTTQKPNHRESRIIQRIQSMFGVHERLGNYAAAVSISVENTVIVLRGELPNNDLRQELIPAIRQAGVLSRVSNCVQVAG